MANIPSVSRDTDQLISLLGLFNANSRLTRLFPGSAEVTPSLRGLQLAEGVAELVTLALRRKDIAIIHGPDFAYSAGLAKITKRSIAPKAIRLLLAGKPFLPISVSDEEFTEVFERLELDTADDLPVFLNQNHHLIILGKHRGNPCVVHFADNDYGRRAVQRHASGLKAARKILGPTLGNLLPAVLIDKTSTGVGLLVQQRVSHTGIRSTQLSASEMEVFLREALIPLRKMSFVKTGPSLDYEFIGTEIRKVLDHVPTSHSEIDRSIELILAWSHNRKIAAVPLHGDYTPDNILMDADHKVTGIIDWEWFRPNGCPGIDALQLLFSAQAILQNQNMFTVITKFLKDRRIDGNLGNLLPLIGEMYGLSNDDLWHVALLLSLRRLWAGCVATIPNSDTWFEQAVSGPTAAIANPGALQR